MKHLIAVIFAALFSLTSVSAQENTGPLYLLDFVFLNPGQTLADRDAYNGRAAPIGARYGILHIASLDPLVITDGPENLARVDVWYLPSPQSLGAWADDPDYTALRPEVDRVHNMTDLTLYMAEAILPPDLEQGAVYHLELLTFDANTFSAERFVNYILAVDEIAASHGIVRRASMKNVTRLIGSGPPSAAWFNLYSVPGPEEYSAMANDPAYRLLDATRVELFDNDVRIMGAFATPRSTEPQ